ncbi:MAG: hypothetical protein WC356_02300 [Candidatus Micrarchaeia archaeon]|jgi:hypothetical protein
MATSTAIYVPNSGEKEMLKAILLQKAQVLGLYSNQAGTDGSMTIDSLTELATGGGRGYAPIALSNDIVENALTADKWFVYTNATGKAQADYDNAVQTWTFTATDVADAKTVYGVFAISYVIPFDGAVTEIKVGDTVTGHTSAATGVVTGVSLQSGTWAAAGAGYIDIKTKTGTFQDGEELWVAGAKVAVSNTSTTGDAYKRLLGVWAFASGIAVTAVGQSITWDHKMALASGS